MKTCVLLALVTITSASAQAAEPQAGAKPDPALVDAIVRKLESDGTLDRSGARDQAGDPAPGRSAPEYRAVGISGTPTTLIRNNRTGATEMIVGAQPPEALIVAVE